MKKALKGHAKSYSIKLEDNLNPLNHFNKTKELVRSHLEAILKEIKGFKFIETLEITFEKAKEMDMMIYKMAFFNIEAKVITKAEDIDHELSVSKHEMLNTIDQWISEGSGWTIDKIDSHYLNVMSYKPLN